MVSNDLSASILVVSNNCSWVRNILSHMSIFTCDKHADTLPKLTFKGPTLNIISRKKVDHYQLCRPFPQSRGQFRVCLLPVIFFQKKEPVRAASLAEKEVPVPTIRKVSTTLLLQPGLERQVDAGLGALPRVLPGQVAVGQDHVLHSIGDVPEHFRPEDNYLLKCNKVGNCSHHLGIRNQNRTLTFLDSAVNCSRRP